ncbi:hypothetical protein JOF53_000408 [Crossiella equi]|uniref:Uncharacterized protein n=1 Tax=Crossiella equi TaxID=130796 RepID=A0ABS5A4R8_9PSEU|nr:hypothetical protein [Crossiella equi]MBP2471536.1 hypothetical protein [Crossiella equi]
MISTWTRRLAAAATALALLTGFSAATATAAPILAAAQLPDPAPEDQERLREIAGAIWTPELAAGWNMNDDVADILSQATGRILECSKAMALVPRPPAFLPGLSYLRSYWKQLKEYFQVVYQNRGYRVCVVSTAAYYRSPIEMASQGI